MFKSFIFCFILCFQSLVANLMPAKGKSADIFELKTGNTLMRIATHGGRIISYTYKNKELLTQAKENQNYGSTLWTAPQSAWGWPPSEVFDKNEYTVKNTGRILKMVSQPDSKSGFQLEKKWRLVGADVVQVDYKIRNISSKPKSVGAWEVTRVPSGGIVLFPQGESGKVPKSTLIPDPQKDGVNWISVSKAPLANHVKLFSTAGEGWLAYVIDGLLFIKQFPDTHPVKYAPEQGEVEVYFHKDKSYIELENQGEYELLEPGKTLNYRVNWRLVAIPTSLNIEVGSKELLTFVRKNLEK
jgi:hypothetical protein